LIHVKNPVAPAGMFINAPPPHQPSPLIPGGSPGPLLITSWGIDSLPSSSSPRRHSPKAMVLLVPSVTSRTPIGGEASCDLPLMSDPPANRKMPLGGP